jgi:hypothetical protein
MIEPARDKNIVSLCVLGVFLSSASFVRGGVRISNLKEFSVWKKR